MTIIEFEQQVWYRCDHSLSIVNAPLPCAQEPMDWPFLGTGEAARKAQEEVLETILALNLKTLLRERVQYLFRAGDTWGIADITGVDNLGRIHLFELKRDTVHAAVPEQLGAYLLEYLFKDGDSIIDELWKSNLDMPMERWALYIAAAHSNSRTSNMGRHEVNEWLPQIQTGELEPFEKSSWLKTYHEDPSQTTRLCTQALIAKTAICRPEVSGVSGADIEGWANRIFDAVTCQKPVRPTVRPRSEAVIWLVGRAVDEGVLERVRLWRRAGIDARCLLLDVRQSPDTGEWLVGVQRESFPERDAALDAVASRQPEFEMDDWARRLELRFYETRAASDTNLAGGGFPLRGSVEIALAGPGGCEHRLFPAAV